MKNRLPVQILDLELPEDNFEKDRIRKEKRMYGYVSILYILSLVVTGISVILIITLKR